MRILPIFLLEQVLFKGWLEVSFADDGAGKVGGGVGDNQGGQGDRDRG